MHCNVVCISNRIFVFMSAVIRGTSIVWISNKPVLELEDSVSTVYYMSHASFQSVLL